MKEPVIIHIERTTEAELIKLDAELPSDIHLVRYKKPTWKKKERVSAIRAFRQVDIFDHLHDAGYAVLEIKSGFGRIKPKLLMRLAFDIETDGLLRGLTKIHCIAAQDLDTNETYFWDNGQHQRRPGNAQVCRRALGSQHHWVRLPSYPRRFTPSGTTKADL